MLNDAFSVLDTDSDGRISREELFRFFRSLGECPRESEIEEMMKILDVDGSGTIEISELKNLMECHKDDDECKEIFNSLEKDGLINKKDLTKIATICHFTLPNDIPYDKNGNINFTQFKALYQGKNQTR